MTAINTGFVMNKESISGIDISEHLLQMLSKPLEEYLNMRGYPLYS